MDFKNTVDHCGDDSRSLNPVLNSVDLFTKDRSLMRDNERRRQAPRHQNEFSMEEFEQFEDPLAREFFRNNERHYRDDYMRQRERPGYMGYRRQPNYMDQRYFSSHGRLTEGSNQLIDEFIRLDTKDEEESNQYFEKIYESKNRHRRLERGPMHWRDEFLNYENGSSHTRGEDFRKEFLETYKDDSLFSEKEFIEQEDKVDNLDWVDEFKEHEEQGRMYLQDDKNDWAAEFENFSDNIDAQEFLDQYQEELLRKQTYLFSENNPFDGDPNAYETGIKLLREGHLEDAILAFESVVKENETSVDGWYHLGMTHAENENDHMSTLALEKAVSIEPTNGKCLLNLAVCLTNNYEPQKVFDCLIRWAKSNQEYQHLAEPFILSNLTQSDDVIDLYIKMARMRSSDPDPDVQIALGLLFALKFNFEKAADCFKSALLKRPKDYSLWNKLGATLANGKKYEEAIEAYYHALNIKPVYTRARSNLGISFSSLRKYSEAAKSFLGAVSIAPRSDNIWDNLITTFKLMEREDLEKKCKLRDPDLFRDDFNF